MRRLGRRSAVHGSPKFSRLRSAGRAGPTRGPACRVLCRCCNVCFTVCPRTLAFTVDRKTKGSEIGRHVIRRLKRMLTVGAAAVKPVCLHTGYGPAPPAAAAADTAADRRRPAGRGMPICWLRILHRVSELCPGHRVSESHFQAGGPSHFHAATAGLDVTQSHAMAASRPVVRVGPPSRPAAAGPPRDLMPARQKANLNLTRTAVHSTPRGSVARECRVLPPKTCPLPGPVALPLVRAPGPTPAGRQPGAGRSVSLLTAGRPAPNRLSESPGSPSARSRISESKSPSRGAEGGGGAETPPR